MKNCPGFPVNYIFREHFEMPPSLLCSASPRENPSTHIFLSNVYYPWPKKTKGFNNVAFQAFGKMITAHQSSLGSHFKKQSVNPLEHYPCLVPDISQNQRGALQIIF